MKRMAELQDRNMKVLLGTLIALFTAVVGAAGVSNKRQQKVAGTVFDGLTSQDFEAIRGSKEARALRSKTGFDSNQAPRE